MSRRSLPGLAQIQDALRAESGGSDSGGGTTSVEETSAPRVASTSPEALTPEASTPAASVEADPWHTAEMEAPSVWEDRRPQEAPALGFAGRLRGLFGTKQ